MGTGWRQQSACQENKTPDGNYKILGSQRAWQHSIPEKDTFNPGKVSARILSDKM